MLTLLLKTSFVPTILHDFFFIIKIVKKQISFFSDFGRDRNIFLVARTERQCCVFARRKRHGDIPDVHVAHCKVRHINRQTEQTDRQGQKASYKNTKKLRQTNR